MKRLVIDASKCAGCRICELACSFKHEGVFSPHLSRISVIKKDEYGFDYPLFCRQCDDCPPIRVCPVEALSRAEDDTIRVSDDCTGCALCVEACTFGAVSFDGSAPLICDLCDGEPFCVEMCPTDALSFVELELFGEKVEDAKDAQLRRWGIVG
ncbi:MAG: 4Fe-4S dicluster domain-containing protein [Candidatus Bathyarchaeia archaeon]